MKPAKCGHFLRVVGTYQRKKFEVRKLDDKVDGR
jgi:hypothetical protein